MSSSSDGIVWKTKGHPWVDDGHGQRTNTKVTCSLVTPTSQSTNSTSVHTGSIVAYAPTNPEQRTPALARVLVGKPMSLEEWMKMTSIADGDSNNNNDSNENDNNNNNKVEKPGDAPDIDLVLDIPEQDMTVMQDELKQSSASNDPTVASSAVVLPPLKLQHPYPGSFPASSMIQRVQERYQTRLDQYVREHILPPLVALAALEEATLQLVHRAMQAQQHLQEQQNYHDGHPQPTTAAAMTAHPPLYYSKPPNHYLTAPTMESVLANHKSSINANESTAETKPSSPYASLIESKEHMSSTPSAWLARIKLGCQQAANEYATHQQQQYQWMNLYQQFANAQQQLEQPTMSETTSERRSSSRVQKLATEQLQQQTRQTRSATESMTRQKGSGGHSVTESYIKGHRIATFLQQQWEEERKGEEEDEPHADAEEEMEVEQIVEEKDGPDGKKEEETTKPGKKAVPKEGNDDEWDEDAADEEEEEESEEEEVSEEEEESEDEEEDEELANPFLQPTYGDVLKCLKKVRLEDIQESIPYWCQEEVPKAPAKNKRLPPPMKEGEIENVLDVNFLPLDTLVLGISAPKTNDPNGEVEPETNNDEPATDKSQGAAVDDTNPKETKQEDAPELAAAKLIVADAADNGGVTASDIAMSEDWAKRTAEAAKATKPEETAVETTTMTAVSVAANGTVAPEKAPSILTVDSTATTAVADNTAKNGSKMTAVGSVIATPGTTTSIAEVSTSTKIEGSDGGAVKSEVIFEAAIGEVKKEDVVMKSEETPEGLSSLSSNKNGATKVEGEKPKPAKSEVEEGEDEEEFSLQNDRVIIQWEVPDSLERTPTKKQLYSFLQKLDQTSFGRHKFTLKRLQDELLRQEEEWLQQQLPDEVKLQQQDDEMRLWKAAEIKFKQAKEWDKWRYESIHGGYTKWPTWHQAVFKWQKERMKDSSTEAAASDEPAADSNDLTSEAQIEADRAKALELAEQEKAAAAALADEEAAGGRRRARRAAAAAADNLNYAGQSNKTAKELMEALIKQCAKMAASSHRIPTAFYLQSQIIADGSANALKRTQTALGRCVWKCNQLARLSPDADWTDKPLVEQLAQGPLLKLPELEAPPAEDPMEVDASAGTEVVSQSTQQTGTAVAVPSKEECHALMEYLRLLHRTELQLRKSVLEQLSDIPIPIIATAADERLGSTEAMDEVDFQDPSTIEWKSYGHPLIGKHVVRPAQMQNTNDMTLCNWYTVRNYSPSIPSATAEEPTSDIGNIKEPVIVERRMRFRAAPYQEEGQEGPDDFGDDEYLILTEAQVHAGMKAAEMEEKVMALEKEEEEAGILGHPFGGSGVNANITLFPITEGESNDASPSHYTVAGHQSVIGKDKQVVYRVLMLPTGGGDGLTPTARWATLDVSESTAMTCHFDDDDASKSYKIQQSEFHHESPAFAECQNIVGFLERHSKADPFQEPVDAIALGIPHYLNVIKHPMDVSTLSKKLEQGVYSNVPPSQSRGRSPIARMLNGPFRADVELIFDNAMLFNPPDFYIHQYAAAVKKAVTRKIDQVSQAADQKYGRSREKQSIYIDEDSDAYEYESDNDDEYDGGRKRKRSKSRTGPKRDENSTRALEHEIRLQKTLSETMGLRGEFANLPVNSNTSSFSLPPLWSCKRKAAGLQSENADENDESKSKASHEDELQQLVELHRHIEAEESAGLRRSTRAHQPDDNGRKSSKAKATEVEFFTLDPGAKDHILACEELSKLPAPTSRKDIEYILERLHESYYSKLYQKFSTSLESAMETNTDEDPRDAVGSFANGSFPPYLGRVVPVASIGRNESSWEIRSPFVIPALRWVIRGLIHSGHLGAVEPLEQDVSSSGVIITNHVYYCDPTMEPFEALDLKELQKRKRAGMQDDESSEDEVELSAYEQLRAQRVARNAERLKALGLA